MRLGELVYSCGSKNAGPFLITLDVLCKDREAFDTIRASGAITPENIGALYSVAPEDVHIVEFEAAPAIKIVIPRLSSSGDVFDTDVYGCQQHVPLAELEIPEPVA